MRASFLAMAVAAIPFAPVEAPPTRWGAAGHEMAARAAVQSLPVAVPAFFREAGEQLVYLDPEPDRWRVSSRREMSEAWSYDHFINLENVPEAAFDAPHRYAYLSAVRSSGLAQPEQVGLLPFRIVELYQRLVTEWTLWRRESDPTLRSWIEARIINDAGLLGHYVTDGAQPHHTTIHYNGWAEGAANPEGYNLDRGFHGRFETGFVQAHITQRDVSQRVGAPRAIAGEVRPRVLSYMRTTHALVDDLYRLDRDEGFAVAGPASTQAVDFAASRLAAGAEMLAVLWLSAWEESR